MSTPTRSTFVRAALGELRELVRDVAGTIEAGGLDDAQRAALADGIVRATEVLDDAHRRAAQESTTCAGIQGPDPQAPPVRRKGGN